MLSPADYLLDNNVIFLNHGSFGACPRVVFDRYQAWQRELERQPVEFLGRRSKVLIREALLPLAAFVGTDADNLFFVNNATSGLNLMARSLDLAPGDEILTSNHEYGALNLMWRYLSRETGCIVRAMPLADPLTDADSVVEAIWSGVTERTKLIFLSHITSETALILPVQALCQRARQAGILTMIDGAHVPGHLPLDLDALGADFYSGNCHKWLSAPKGSALAYVRPEHHAMIDPLVISWGWDQEDLFSRTGWSGTRDIAAYLTVPTAIAFQQQHDWSHIYEACHALACHAAEQLHTIAGTVPLAAPHFYGQMVAVRLPDSVDVAQLKTRLYDEYRIEVPVHQHAGRKMMRVSIQAYNTAEDVQALVSALARLLGTSD